MTDSTPPTTGAVAPARDLADPAVCLDLAREAGGHVFARLASLEGEAVYSGVAGVAHFFYDLYGATKEDQWLQAGRMTTLPALSMSKEEGGGLYTGFAGVGEACLAAYRATGEKQRLSHAVYCADRLAAPEGTDVISGAAGTGMFLLNLHEATGEKKWLAAARERGEYLVEHAVRKDGQAHWPVRPDSDRVYVGFSHGAAGIGTFLLDLYLATKKATYRKLAEEAAAFVVAHATPDGDGWKWAKLVPPREDGFPVQWCHGSPGIALFFLALDNAFGDEQYAAALERCLASIRREGRTARIGGCQCHGVSGNAEIFIDAYRASGDAAHLATARAFAADLVGPDGLRPRVGAHVYPPGYMLGLAGIGRFFLRLAKPADFGPAFMVDPVPPASR